MNPLLLLYPMRFDEVIGQEAIKKHLKQTLAENRVSHAQLFVGPKGCGSLPLAIAYAREILSANAKDPQASHLKCDKLAHPDLHLIFPVNTTQEVKKDPISKKFLAEFREAFFENPYLDLSLWFNHLGIGNKQGTISVLESQQIIHDLSLKPFESDYKVMVIWMPEKMHPAASNKILKILEEPPEKTVFLLVVEDQEKLLPTIVSRTQIVRLDRLTTEELKQALSKEFNANPEEVASAASLADGDYLDAYRHLKHAEALEFNKEQFIQWMRMAFKRDFYSITKWVDGISKVGRERQKAFLNYGLHIFREALITNLQVKELLRVQGDEEQFVKKFSPFVHGGNLQGFIYFFDEAIYHIERNANGKIVFLDLSVQVLKLLKQKAPVKAS